MTPTKRYRDPSTSPSVAFVPQKIPGLTVLYISDDSWCASIYFLLGATEEKWGAWIKEVFCRDDKEMKHHYMTTEVVMDTGATVDVIAFRDDKWDWNMGQMATLVHECHHVTTNILLRKGLTHSRETEEVWAYLQDSIYQRICWAMKNPDKVAMLAKLNEQMWRPKAPKRRTLAGKKTKR